MASTNFCKLDYESITVPTGVVGFTATKIKPTSGLYSGIEADFAMVTVESNSIRYRLDGIDPSSSEGHLTAASDGFELHSATLIRNFKTTRVTSDATIKCTYGWTVV